MADEQQPEPETELEAEAEPAAAPVEESDAARQARVGKLEGDEEEDFVDVRDVYEAPPAAKPRFKSKAEADDHNKMVTEQALQDKATIGRLEEVRVT